MMPISEVNPASWRFAPVVTDKNQRRAQFLGNQAVSLTTRDNPLYCPFGASLYDANDLSDRKNINFSVTPDLEHWINKFGATVVKLAHASSVEIFGKQLSESECLAMYSPFSRRGRMTILGRSKPKLISALLHDMR